MNRLSRTGIEYGDYGWNFYPGCLHKQQDICPVTHCWAESMSKRQKQDFHKPHLISERLLGPLSVKKPSRILVNFMGDLFGDWIDLHGYDVSITMPDGQNIVNCHLTSVMRHIISYCPQHTFIFLTKRPDRLKLWGRFQDNCWVGVTMTETYPETTSLRYLTDIQAKVKWISFEPLLKWTISGRLEEAFKMAGIKWLVIGQQMPVKLATTPKIEWIRDIVEAADKAGIPVWLKNNLGWPRITADGSASFYKKHAGTWILRQEYPDGKG